MAFPPPALLSEPFISPPANVTSPSIFLYFFFDFIENFFYIIFNR